MTLAEQYFGDSTLGYPGFGIIIRSVEVDFNVEICKNNVNKYKWELLARAFEARPRCTDIDEMATVVSEITGVTFDSAALDQYRQAYEQMLSCID